MEHPIPKPRTFFLSKVATASFIGGLLEWYDFYIFATASALVLGKLFFPGGDPLASTMEAFGTFAAGFLARPIGGILFGHIGDRLGRKASLIATLLIIGLGTFLIGCLPTYQQIGALAPVLLVILRVAQGVGLGGEYGGASLMMIEHAPVPDRGFWGSLPQAASPAGLLLATGSFGLVSLLPDDAFWSWGWRLPFLTSAIAMVIGFFIRMQLDETPEFENAKKGAAKKNERAPISDLVRTHLYNTILATGARLAETVSGNMIKSFGLTYATMVLGFQKEVPLNALTGTAIIGVIATPLYGMLGDRFGQRYVYMAGTFFAAAMAFPFFWLLDFRTPVALWIGFAIAFNIGPTLMLSVQPTFFTQLFDTRVRYTGLSVAYQVSAIIGGFVPLIALWTLRVSNNTPWITAGVLVAVSLLSLTCAWLAILRRNPRQPAAKAPVRAKRKSA